jgi:hypothetical protein
MSAAPSLEAARAYAKRRGIEAMFSDFKSRGFGLNDSQLRVTARINWLIMIMAIALYWAVEQRRRQKKRRKINSRSLVSAFKSGLRAILILSGRKRKIPKLWEIRETVSW